jgi:hypothetical protein
MTIRNDSEILPLPVTIIGHKHVIGVDLAKRQILKINLTYSGMFDTFNLNAFRSYHGTDLCRKDNDFN